MSKLNYNKFNLWLSENKSYFETFNKIGSPIPFDVSLRDGLQSMKAELSITEKKDLYKTLVENYNPKSIEIGSLVSKKVLPIFSDSIELYNYCITENQNTDHYLLIPCFEKLDEAVNNSCYNLSFISSISDSFQIKNTKKSVNDIKLDILKMTKYVKTKKSKIKLYLSCINECPIEGKINNQKIIDEIKWYYDNIKPDILCLSDTCGTLTNNDYLEIIDNLNIPYHNLGIHLHYDEENESEVIKILKSSFTRNIKHIDVSFVENGGCSVTIKNPKKNLTYDLYYKTLQEFIKEFT